MSDPTPAGAPYPRQWEADVLLRDGRAAHLRPITPADAEKIADFQSSLSPESIYFRYFTLRGDLTPKELKQLTTVDHDRRVALVLTLGPQIIGVGRYEATGATEAEIALTVRDNHQARGVGSILQEHLAAAGRERGLRTFVGTVLSENSRMLDVFADAGFEAQQQVDDGMVSVSIDLEPTEQSLRVMEAREHRAEAVSIKQLLSPQSVVLVGVSVREGTFGHTLLRNILDAGFTGELSVVHPSAESIAGVKAYPSVRDVPGSIDLAIIAVPAERVLNVARACSEKDARAIVVISSGFAEAGEEGRELQRQLVQVARGRGMRVVGPNCLGIINTAGEVQLNASLAPAMPPRGRIGFFSQSGALGIALLETVRRRGLGVSTFVGAGNRADVSGNDVLQYWEEDPDTDVILLYLESIGNPRKFTRLARRISRHTPIVAMKTGGSMQARPLGHAVRRSSLPPAALEALFTQSGVIQTETLNHLFDVSQVLSFQPLPQGSTVAIVGNSDALGSLAADAAQARGLEVLDQSVSLGASATAGDFDGALAGLLDDPAVDSILAIFVPPLSTAGEGAVEAIAHAGARLVKPVVATVVGVGPDGASSVELLMRRDAAGVPMQGSVPAFFSVEEAIRAIAAVTDYSTWRHEPAGLMPEFDDLRIHDAGAMLESIMGDSLTQVGDERMLDENQAAGLLGCYGIDLWPSAHVTSEDQAVELSQTLGYPVGLRLSDPELAGRADLGTQRLNLESDAAVRTAFRRLQNRFGVKAERMTLQRMAQPGVACVVGSIEDPLFGPVVSFGISGITSELLGDRAYAIPPLTDVDAARIIRAPRAAPMLLGGFGAGEQALAELEELILRVSVMVDEHPEISDVVLDPVLVSSKGLAVLGAKMSVKVPQARTESPVRRLTD